MEKIKLIENKTVELARDQPLLLDSGKRLGPIVTAYTTYGQLNDEKSKDSITEISIWELFHILIDDWKSADCCTSRILFSSNSKTPLTSDPPEF